MSVNLGGVCKPRVAFAVRGGSAEPGRGGGRPRWWRAAPARLRAAPRRAAPHPPTRSGGQTPKSRCRVRTLEGSIHPPTPVRGLTARPVPLVPSAAAAGGRAPAWRCSCRSGRALARLRRAGLVGSGAEVSREQRRPLSRVLPPPPPPGGPGAWLAGGVASGRGGAAGPGAAPWGAAAGTRGGTEPPWGAGSSPWTGGDPLRGGGSGERGFFRGLGGFPRCRAGPRSRPPSPCRGSVSLPGQGLAEGRRGGPGTPGWLLPEVGSEGEGAGWRPRSARAEIKSAPPGDRHKAPRAWGLRRRTLWAASLIPCAIAGSPGQSASHRGGVGPAPS